MKVERSPRRLLNGLAEKRGFALNICAFGDWIGIGFGEAGPASFVIGTRCNQRGSVCESECAD
jgi:hypothetical protein